MQTSGVQIDRERHEALGARLQALTVQVNRAEAERQEVAVQCFLVDLHALLAEYVEVEVVTVHAEYEGDRRGIYLMLNPSVQLAEGTSGIDAAMVEDALAELIAESDREAVCEAFDIAPSMRGDVEGELTGLQVALRVRELQSAGVI